MHTPPPPPPMDRDSPGLSEIDEDMVVDTEDVAVVVYGEEADEKEVESLMFRWSGVVLRFVLWLVASGGVFPKSQEATIMRTLSLDGKLQMRHRLSLIVPHHLGSPAAVRPITEGVGPRV